MYDNVIFNQVIESRRQLNSYIFMYYASFFSFLFPLTLIVGCMAEKRNLHATQVLMRIRRKLEGIDGSHTALSVEGHVNHLIEVR